VIVGLHDPLESETLQNTARSQAGLERARIQIAVRGEKGNQATEAELVRKAIARNPLVLVVEPSDPADVELAKAVDLARSRGVPVILIGRALKESSPGPPSRAESGSAGATSSGFGQLLVVAPEPFSTAATALVEAAINNARNGKLSPQAGAVITVNTASDSLVPERVQALRDALTKAGVTAIDEVRFGNEPNTASKTVAEFLRANRKATLVLATDRGGLMAAFAALNELGEKRPYVIAGFSADESGSRMVAAGEFAAIAVFSPERLLRKSIMTAAAVGRGEKLPDRVMLIVPVHVSPSESALARMYKVMGDARKGSSRAQAKKNH
jgi:ABC-type sugar transport system substrate-binding protein